MSSKKKKRIVITGGHVTPALAVIDELKNLEWQIFYIGRTQALEGDNTPSPEPKLVRAKGCQFLPITTGRISRTLSLSSMISIAKIPLGFVTAFKYLMTIRPRVILAFGGYIAVPVVIVGWLMKIPVVIHEQTLSPGLANRLLSHLAKRVCIAWEKTRFYFPQHKTVVTGNPLRKEVFQVQKKPLLSLDKPLIYITGGNVGSHSINVVIEDILSELLTDFVIVHQCGQASTYNDYERLSRLRRNLPAKLRRRYYLIPYVGSDHIGWVFHQAELMITRAGANTVSEIIALSIPAILIPLPWSGNQEQQKNAELLQEYGAAKLIMQSELSPKRLLLEIRQVISVRAQLIKNLSRLKSLRIESAVENIVSEIESVVKL